MLPTKLEVFSVLLRQGSVFVHFDARHVTSIPEHLQGKDQVVFQFGLDMPVPIPDMAYDTHGVSGTLSFNGKPMWVSIPWDATFAIVGESTKGLVWHSEMPASIAASIAAHEAGKVVSIFKHEPSGKSRPKVTSKEGADRSHLRLVK